MPPNTIPKIQRINLVATTLHLKAMGINDLLSFDFMDPLSSQALISTMEQLYSLGALDKDGLFTKPGRKMAEFPLDPPLSKMLLASVDLGCNDKILTIIAMIQTGNIFNRPREKQAQVDQKRAKFFQPEGSHLTLLVVYEAWKAKNFYDPWCFENVVQQQSMRRAQNVWKQLLSIIITSQQKITLQNKHNEKLVGVLHETGSPGVVVLCHGFLSTKECDIMMNISVALENEGISAFRFDFAGNGESEGSFEYGNYWREVEDLRVVVEYLIGANRRITAILGHSKGGNIVLLYASKYHDICTVVNISGRYKLDRGNEERLGKDVLERIKRDGHIDVKNSAGDVQYRVTAESMMDRLNTNMHEACLLIDKECRVLTVHGSADEVIPVEDASGFAKIIPNHKLRIVEGADHGYTSHQAELASVVLPFIREGLQQNT
ncbi:hypothetical protein ACH5RR_004060 [Cinchona calisaya]|uniref:RNA helicase n=1 Tax=Cinchona calisaya TaxID=153742 RepID=A0ABD3AWL9_9GENT